MRDRIPHASIGSDVIVGFPGESEEHFNRTLSYLSESQLTHLHVFPYSDRPGTRASRLFPKVPGAAIRRRARAIREVAAQLTLRFRASQVGTIRPALTLDDGSTALTDNYMKVKIPSCDRRNERVRVRLMDAEGMRGEVVGG